ncbi:hypothetical protein MKOR_17190 [Mycolicibacillus koreensis]|nr:hypothetical protein MKOR_17190 [Mycolicibacillus koreensis]
MDKARAFLYWMRDEHPVHKGASPKSATDTLRIGHPRTPIKSEEPNNDSMAALSPAAPTRPMEPAMP